MTFGKEKTMNKNLKTISAALLAAAMCASLAGCSQSGTSNTGKPVSGASGNSISNNGQSSTVSETEGGNASDNDSTSESPSSAFDDITVAITDEILNAKFDSGLIQCFNDVFQCGGYVSATEFIEKYKSSYDFRIYSNGKSVNEETLSEKVEPSLRGGRVVSVAIHGKPRFTVKGREDVPELIVELINPTDNPIPYSECYVDYVWISGYECCVHAGGFCAGYCDQGIGKYFLTEYAKGHKVNEKNPDFIETDVAEYLRSLGYEEITVSSSTKGYDLEPSMEYNNKYFKDSNGNYYFYVVGEPNAFGARPFYRNSVGFTGGVSAVRDIGYIFE